MRELNWKPGQAVEMSVLGEEGCAGAGRILELSGRRMRLGAGLTVKTGAAVRLEWDGQLVLGEVLNTASWASVLALYDMTQPCQGA